MKLLRVLIFIAVLSTKMAAAADSIGIATPEDIQKFNAAVAKKLGKRDPGVPRTADANSAAPLPMPGASIRPAPGAETPAAASSSAGEEKTTKPANGRDEVIGLMVQALRKQDLSQFRATLAPAVASSLGTQEVMARLSELVKDQEEIKLVDEESVHSVGGAREDGTVKAILQRFTGTVQGKSASGTSSKLFGVKLLCGMKTRGEGTAAVEAETCVIQGITGAGLPGE
jgi:hypothetical protein